MGLKQLLHGEYTIGWICALPLEQTAAMYMLDERHKDLQNPLSDENTYTLGRIGGHNVVIVGLPTGRIGTNDSAAVITRMASTFPNIKFGMMVGVGGGIPEKTRLGDVVICSALGTNAGVVQHDMGTRAGDRFETRGFLNGPPAAVLTALAKFQADPFTPGQMHSHLDDMAAIPHVDESYLKSKYREDILFESDYNHVKKGKDCSGCDKRRILPREPRRTDFEIHYGLIASGNAMVKDAKLRDELCKRYKNHLYCIEMEAAGLMNNFPCVVIRGICDYADSHAGKEWQNYAASVAAACTKTLLGVVPEREVRRLQSVQDSVVFSNTGILREYDMRHYIDSPPPSAPQEFEGTTAPASRMIEEPRTSYNSSLPGIAYSRVAVSHSGDTIHSTHQSAKDYLTDNKKAIFPIFHSGPRDAQLDTFSHPPRAMGPISRKKHDKSSISEIFTGDNISTTDPNTLNPTDSGYATIHTRDTGFDKAANHGNWNTTQSSQELYGQDISDAETVYSEESSTADTRRQTYIWELAENLFESIHSIYTKSDFQTNISKSLPDLLQAFALMVGHNAPTQMHRDTMAFVHKYRHEITKAFNDIGLERDESLQRNADNENAMTLVERMNRWLPFCEEDPVGENSEAFMVGEDRIFDEFDGESADSEEEEVSDYLLRAYREFILKSESYEWLLSRLRRELHLYSTQPNTIQAIRGKILSSLPKPHKVSKKVSSQTYTAIFEVDWDVLGFFRTQGYLNLWDEVFEGVITLTGTLSDAQAATCAQYIRQTWPLTGEVMIQLVKGVLRGEEGNLQNCTLPDQTALTSWVNGSRLMVKVYGIAASIAETGEQLAWLGAALRASPRRNRLMLCTPTIKIYQNSPPLCQSELHLSSTNIIYKIGFTMEKDIHASTRVNGQCWHSLFQNPVVVKGYPIPRRIKWGTGLEISLNIMAGLAQSQHISQFKGKIYIKGFSMMILPIEQDGELLSWHLLYNKKGHRISYLDDNIRQEKQDIKQTDLEKFRHILGWCSEIEFYAGSAQAHHPVAHSELPKPHAACALAGVKVIAEQTISGGPAFRIGTKDTPIRISHKNQGYVRQFKWLSTEFILLWDEGEKRGWLIDGTSALLHLLRAFLAHAKEDNAQSAFIFKNEDLQDVEMPYMAKSATAVLINKKNWRLKLYEEDDNDDEHNRYLFKSQIDYFFSLLERLIDYQVDITGDEGIKLQSQPRKFLEGWDFEDIATECPTLHPRVATLEAAGKGWVDFIRGIHAVTLFGRGFGDIFRPTGTNLCKHWARLPKQKYYIAGCLSDLGRLVKQVGNRNDGHIWLTDDVICHTPTSVFMSCQCGDGDALEQNHCEPVQTLFPSALSAKLFPQSRRIPSKGTGAVIFGHHSSFSWIWGDNGHPREEQLIEAEPSCEITEEDLDSFKDSGIDSNLAYTGSEDLISLPTKSSSAQLMGSPSELYAYEAMLESVDSINRGAYSRSHYTVGIICALSTELMAVRALFDRRHANIETIPGDNNQYALGTMAGHFIVAACLPAGEYGTNSAASAASSMKCSFSQIRFCLLVGIAGGAPSKKNDIRLGDVVVSLPTGTGSGVLQYDLGKEREDSHFEMTGFLQRPPRVLTNAINFLRSDPDLGNNPLESYLSKIIAHLPTYGHPGRDLDTSIGTCAVCVAQQTSPESCSHNLQRMPRTTNAPQVHYGLVASGNRVIKDKTFRDRLARERGVLCFEMEAAGIINAVDCLVIRGICDYCDAQKSDIWQKYAAATAAAYARLLLSAVARVEANIGA